MSRWSGGVSSRLVWCVLLLFALFSPARAFEVGTVQDPDGWTNVR